MNNQNQLVLPDRFRDKVRSKKIPTTEIELLQQQLNNVKQLKETVQSKLTNSDNSSPQLLVLNIAGGPELPIEAHSLCAALENTEELLKFIIKAQKDKDQKKSQHNDEQKE